MKRHGSDCDCSPCERHAIRYSRFLAVVFGGLAIFGLYLVGRAGLFAWVTN